MKKLVVNAKFPIDTLNSNPFNSSAGKLYRFVTDIEGLETGDQLVVDTVNGIRIVEFVSYSEEPVEFGDTFNNKKPRWVIQKIELEAHEARLVAAEKADKLKKQMEARRKKAAELEIYEILAKADPEMAKLLEEFKAVQEVL